MRNIYVRAGNLQNKKDETSAKSIFLSNLCKKLLDFINHVDDPQKFKELQNLINTAKQNPEITKQKMFKTYLIRGETATNQLISDVESALDRQKHLLPPSNVSSPSKKLK